MGGNRKVGTQVSRRTELQNKTGNNLPKPETTTDSCLIMSNIRIHGGQVGAKSSVHASFCSVFGLLETFGSSAAKCIVCVFQVQFIHAPGKAVLLIHVNITHIQA